MLALNIFAIHRDAVPVRILHRRVGMAAQAVCLCAETHGRHSEHQKREHHAQHSRGEIAAQMPHETNRRKRSEHQFPGGAAKTPAIQFR